MRQRQSTGTKVCECGSLKDYRAAKCAKCAGVSVPIKQDGVVFYDDPLIREVVRTSFSLAEVSSKTNHARHTLKKYILNNKIDISHFRGAKGRDMPYENVFVVGNRRVNNSIKRYGILYGVLQEVCSECGCEKIWNNKELNLELHHINGNPFDNTPPNITLLCPNCHSQTYNNKGKSGLGKPKKVKKILNNKPL